MYVRNKRTATTTIAIRVPEVNTLFFVVFCCFSFNFLLAFFYCTEIQGKAEER